MSDPWKYSPSRSQSSDERRQLPSTQQSFGQPLSTNTQQPRAFGRGQLSIPAPTSGFRWGSHLIPTYGRLPSSARRAVNVTEEHRISPYKQRRFPGSALRQVPAVLPARTTGQTPVYKSPLYPGSAQREQSSTDSSSAHPDSTSSPLRIRSHADYMFISQYPEWTDIGKKYIENIPSGEALAADEIQFCEKHGITFEQELGKGSYGAVWMVNTTNMFRDPNDPNKYIDKKIACKIAQLRDFNVVGQTLPEGVQRLFLEVDLQKALNHKNIVKCEHFLTIPDPNTKFPYIRLLIFMELCDGDVNNMIDNHPDQRLTDDEARDLMVDVSAGLQYLHRRHICHLDIKVKNIMYVKEGTGRICYKLGDFGVAKHFGSESSARFEGWAGTRVYMAPEMKCGSKKPIDGKPADIYSLGCTLAECVIGKQEWESGVQGFHSYGPGNEAYVCTHYNISEPCGLLIRRMTIEEPKDRPTIDQVCTDRWLSRKY